MSALHWPSIRGRARADAGPLLLVAAVVAAITLLAGAVPPLLRDTADDAVRDAVATAGAGLTVHALWERDDGPTRGRVRMPRLADDVDDLRTRAASQLGPELRSILQPPIAVVTSPVLNVTDGSVLRKFQLTYLAADDGPDVTWIAGAPPAGTVDDNYEVPYSAPPWTVQVGLSEPDAAALGLRPGDRIQLKDEQKTVKDVRVSGIYRPVDPADPAWRLVPALLGPVAGADGIGTTRFAGLLSRDSLPDARLAFDQDKLVRAVEFAPRPSALTWGQTGAVAEAIVALKATSSSSGVFDDSLRWESHLDGVLRDAEQRVNAASAQASVLLTAVLAATALSLLLAADLLVRRRVPALTAARLRGASLPTLFLELLLESVALAALAGAVGLVVALLLTGGAGLLWALPVVLTAALAAPLLGTLAAARATNDRRVPANRSARRWASRTAALRRFALEGAAVLGAVAALVALRQRGLTTDGLPSGGSALGAFAGALILLRVLPAGTGLALRRALRSRRPLAVFGAARAAETATRALPTLALVTAATLAAFALTVAATAAQGLSDGAWRTVGADARLDLTAEPPPGLPGVYAQISQVRLTADATAVDVRLVVVDAVAYQRLLATTPLPDAAALSQLKSPGSPVPALVRGSLRPGMHLQLPATDDTPAVELVAVGAAPPVGDASTDVVIVDTAALAAAGLPTIPNTVWLTSRVAPPDGADLVLREDVLRERRSAPLTAGLLRLSWTAAVVLLLLALLALALGAAAGAPDRWQTLTRLRTLGLRPRDARWVAVGELLPPVLLAAVGGPLLGALLAWLVAGPLDLRLLTAQDTAPALVLPWWSLAAVAAALPVALAVVVPVESALRRRQRMSEVLRAGER
ncbi:ABC transporter permease [Dactylosporangium sucinum]|uniref:ABC3 transporter permease C-terminal domain-containing protein n=1 Tax=Dactylosporangium sucinum TaxID=1424081 RepID=A0A917X4N3_9ACTN|nr:ABC transporter permease [Dactylosporangium sucinum]GGM65677.1 hypothetical protein GCM10007977_079080 [Dactylosporangium sucinum]